MAVIIIDCPDRTGKDSLINNIAKDRTIIKDPIFLHCFSPQKNSKRYSLDYYLDLYKMINDNPNLNFILNRSSLGEYTYGTMYRGLDYHLLEIVDPSIHIRNHDVTIVSLSADPLVLLEREDGKSFSNNIMDKTKELELFREVTEFMGGFVIDTNNKTQTEVFEEFKRIINCS